MLLVSWVRPTDPIEDRLEIGWCHATLARLMSCFARVFAYLKSVVAGCLFGVFFYRAHAFAYLKKDSHAQAPQADFYRARVLAYWKQVLTSPISRPTSGRSLAAQRQPVAATAVDAHAFGRTSVWPQEPGKRSSDRLSVSGPGVSTRWDLGHFHNPRRTVMSRFKRFGLVLIAASLGSIGAQAATFNETGSVGPQGTQAGTTISNQARAEFAINGNPVTELSNIESFDVDERIQVDVTVQTPAVSVQPGQTQRIQPFLVTNLGNGQEVFNLTVLPNVGGDDFDPIFAANNLVYRASGATCSPSDITGSQEFNTGTDQLDLAPGGTILICAPADIPAGVVDGDVGFLDLRAASATTGASAASPGDVLAGAGDGGVDAVVVQNLGRDEDRGVYVVSAVEVTVVKSITQIDDGFSTSAPGGGATFIPGAIVTYQLDVTVEGTGTAQNLSIVDDIRNDGTEIVYVPNSVVVNGTGRTDAVDADNVSVTDVTLSGVPHKRITINFGTTSGDPIVEHEITFQVEIQ